MGVSVEDQRSTSRIDLLRNCPAHVRFISAEPLIEQWTTDLTGIDWLIVGGESGKGFRPMPHAWARHLRDLSLSQNIAFFFKQSAAFRTEMGTSLQHEDGSFWMWQQFPDNYQSPVIGEVHHYTYETLPVQEPLF
jgi:protein gp37